MNPVARHIDLVIKHALVPALRRCGFRGSGRSFHRRLDHVVHVVNVQASHGNLAETGRFTVNLGVYFPAVALTIDPGRVLEKPKEYECTLRTRIGRPMGVPADFWWPIGPETIDSQLGDEVADTFLTSGLPWLERHSSLETVLVELGRDIIARAACLVVLGRREEAQTLVQTSIAEDPERTAYLVGWSKRRGLLLSPNEPQN